MSETPKAPPNQLRGIQESLGLTMSDLFPEESALPRTEHQSGA